MPTRYSEEKKRILITDLSEKFETLRRAAKSTATQEWNCKPHQAVFGIPALSHAQILY